MICFAFAILLMYREILQRRIAIHNNGLVDRLIDQLVQPFRRIHLKDEELVCMSAITVLNSMAKELSREAAAKVNKLRERVNDTLYQIIRESRKEEPSPASQFGNLLLYIPIATDCANLMNENLRFALTFSPQGGIPLLSSVFGCFPVEPFLESEFKLASIIEKIDEKGININVGKNLIIICKNAETQTDGNGCRREPLHRLKRRFPSSFTSPVEDDTTSDFILLQAPGSYTLAEMFDDCANNYDSPGPSRTSLTMTNSIPYTSQQQLLQHLAPPRGKRGPSNKRLIQLYQTSEIIQSPCSSNSLPSSSEVAQRRLTLDSTYKTHAITQHLRSVASANSLETTAPLRSQLSSTNIVAEQNPVNKVGNNTPQINSYGTTLQIDYLTNSDATQSIIMRSDVPTNLNDNFSYEQQHNCQQQQFPAFHPQLQELSSFSNNSIHHTPCEATLGWSAMPQQQYPKADRTQLFNQPPMVFTNEYSTRFSLMQQTNYVNESHYCTLPRTPHYASQKPTTTQSAADQLYDGINFNSTHKY